MARKKTPTFGMRSEDGKMWEYPSDILKNGDILRTPRNEKDKSQGWLYGVCTGGGFGCDPKKLGHAIYMYIEADSADACLKYREKPDDKLDEKYPGIHLRTGDMCSVRWEKGWLIQRLIEAKTNAS